MPRNEMQHFATVSPELTPAQVQVIAALAAGVTVTDAARQAGVDRATVHRWKKDDAVFAAELNREKLERRERIQSEYHALLEDAVRTVRQVMTGPDVPPAVRLRAAVSVLKTTGLGPETVGPAALEG